MREDRLTPVPPFTYCGVDFFGSLHTKEGRKAIKRHWVFFTCMASIVIHLETANSLSTDSFISPLRRSIAMPGPIRQLRTDRCTNFVEADKEFRECLFKMGCNQIQQSLLKKGSNYLDFNVPSTSHIAGV